MQQRPLYQLQEDRQELVRLKEAFVSNLPGTSRWEVFCVLSSLPLCLLIAAYIEARLAARLRSSSAALGGRKQQQQHPCSRWLLRRTELPKLPFEYVGVVLPPLMLLMSVAPAEPAFLLLFLLWGSLALKLWMRLAHGPGARQHVAHMLQHMTTPRKRFVSAFRGGVMVATCLGILGVDFPAFPRRYAKAEGFGGGVMDVGVGAIVFAGGLVSAVAAGAAGAAGAAAAELPGPAAAAAAVAGAASVGAAAAGKAGSSGSSSSGFSARARLSSLLRGVRAAVPLLLLGGARELLTAFVGYQVHLGEYGLHWNFFYTIAAVTLLTLAVPVPPRWLGPLGVGLTAAHQVLLSADLSRLASGVSGGMLGGQQLLLHRFPGLLTAASAANSALLVPHSSSSSSDNSSSSGAEVGADFSAAAAAAVGAGALGTVPVKTLGAWVHLNLGVQERQAAGFWASNKEGLASLPGYWALYLLGAAVGQQLGESCAVTAARARAQLSSGGSSSRPGGAAAAVGEACRLVWAWVGVWWVADLALWGLLAVVEPSVEPVSRRTCNLPYVLWTTAQCLAWLLLVVMADLLTSVICGSSGGCGISPGSSGLLAPGAAAAAGHGSSRGSVGRSLEAACAAAAGSTGSGSGGHSSDFAAAATAAGGQQQQHAPLPPSPRRAPQQRRAAGRRGSSGSSPMAAAAAAALTAEAAAAVGAGGSPAAVAAAAAAVLDSPRSDGSSRESSPRKSLSGSRAAAAAAAAAGAPAPGAPERGSPKGGAGGSDHSGGSTPARSRRQQQSRLQPTPQQQQQQPLEPLVHSGSSSGSSSASGGPMRLMLAFNRNMLPLFLAANLLTGAVNLSINTLGVGSWEARAIVGLYMLLLCGLAVLLDKRGITLKPW